MTADPAEGLDGESLAWLRRLGAGGGDRQAAELELHARLVRVARATARRRTASGQEPDDVARQAADHAMPAILAKLGDFRGESRFITWAYRFAILEVSARTGRCYRRDPAGPLDAGQRDRLTSRLDADPRLHAGCREATAVLHVYADLTATGTDAAERYPGVTAHLATCGPCAEDLDGLVLAVVGG